MLYNSWMNEEYTDYEILAEYAYKVRDYEGLTCEIGLRLGDGSKAILNGIRQAYKPRTHIAVDPFGSIPYALKETETIPANFSNEMKNIALKDLSSFCIQNKHINFNFYPLEVEEFMARFADGVPVYSGAKKSLVNEYSLVFLDGPHTLEATLNQVKFFASRTKGYIICDDVVGHYDHTPVNDYLLSQGWTCEINTKVKAVYGKDNI